MICLASLSVQVGHLSHSLHLGVKSNMRILIALDDLRGKLKTRYAPNNLASSSLPIHEDILLEVLFIKQKVLWKQKACDNQINLGKGNAKYFHNKVQVNK